MRITTFGEIMMRLSASGNETILSGHCFETSFAGSEANVLVALAYWGVNTKYLTVLPDSVLGLKAIHDLGKYGVDTSSIVSLEGERMGLLFLEYGANQRSDKVIYDRKKSAFANKKFDKKYFFEEIQDSDFFHWSGITPATSENGVCNIINAIEAASKEKIKISCDLNYRSSLWDYGSNPKKIMPKLLSSANVIIGNEEDAAAMLELNVECDISKGADIEVYKRICDKIFGMFPNCEVIAFTLRHSISANHINWSSVLATRKEFFQSTKYSINNIVDRVGSGDSFAAGILYGLLNFNHDFQRVLEYATAASCLKHSIKGDYCLVKKEDIFELMDGNSLGRIKR